ncbi:DUF3842 family protein [Mahella australiensis]|uniref:DUF3842 family protein n=1 Tax=Mahella australiensis (strain DSM 15567 / CIP 107919 / 50-1 BON) TaxID=697281 RepID=F3ZYA6_MAHA5|nr:DUF3842 family protein [Mahella australiensis]AEE95631.1 hypothetical protein Mahau_0415 [Mahella australiensis 50-1 BON]
MRIAVVDGQGGGIGRHIVDKLRRELPDETEILALGTNAWATAQMLKAGANDGATGEAAIIWNVDKVDVITGTVGILMAHAMMGELTPAIACAVAASSARKILLPVNRCGVDIVGVEAKPLPHLIDDMVEMIKAVAEVR